MPAQPGDVTVVVDAANVVGSRPDGWWRDRAGAAARLLRRLAPLPGSGAAVDGEPVHVAGVVVVLEGRARAAAETAGAAAGVADDAAGTAGGAGTAGSTGTAATHLDGQPPSSEPDGGLRVLAAPGSGDDAIVEVCRATSGRLVVVTADRGLRARLPPAATAVGPRWLDDVVGPPG